MQDKQFAGTILLIDHDISRRTLLTRHFAQKGYELLLAEDSATGIEVFRNAQPEMVISASSCEQDNGFDILRTVVTESFRTPVILISPPPQRDALIKALRLGAMDYFFTPLEDLAVIEHAVRRGIERARLMRQNQSYREELESANAELKQSLRIMKEDQEAGRFVQFKMLPNSPEEILRCRAEHKIIPSLFLSGDFVDYFQLDEAHFVFYLADVSGHGSSSAFVTILLKMLTTDMRRDFLHKQNDTIIHPAKVLQHINEELYRMELGKHLTMFYGVLNVKKNQLNYSAAAHYPPPMLCLEEDVQYIESTALPVGVFADARYDEVQQALTDEFCLIMFSDGIMEILPQDSLQEKEKYLLNLVKSGDKSFHRIYAELKLEKVQNAPDDIGLLVVSRSE